MSSTTVLGSSPTTDDVLFNNTASHHDTTTVSTTTTTSPDMPLVVREILAALLSVMVVVGVGGNGLLCVLVYRKAAMRSAINVLVAQLAMSDVLLSCVVMPLALADLFLPVDLVGSHCLCAVVAFFFEVLVTLNICLLLAISVDRYLIIVHRKEKLNVQRSRVIILLAWAFSLLCAAPPLLGWGRFVAYSSQRLCVKFASSRASDLSYIVVSYLVTKFVPMSAILYSYARILSMVRKKNMKVHHYAVDVSVTHSSGSAPLRAAPHQAAVGGAARDISSRACFCASRAGVCLTCAESQSQDSGVTPSLSSSSSVSFVSCNSTVHLHYLGNPSESRHLPRRSDSVAPKLSSGCSSVEKTHTGSPASTLSSSTPPAVSHQRHINELPSPASCRHHFKKSTSATTHNGSPSTRCSCSEASANSSLETQQKNVERKPEAPAKTMSFKNRHNFERKLTSCSFPEVSAKYVSLENDHGGDRKAVELSMALSSANSRPGKAAEQRTQPHLSSPSGFSPRANGVRRTAGSRRQVVDMSFKTRAFQTILVLSLLLCLCWLPFLTASVLTSLTSPSSSSSSPSSSPSSSSSPFFPPPSSPDPFSSPSLSSVTLPFSLFSSRFSSSPFSSLPSSSSQYSSSSSSSSSTSSSPSFSSSSSLVPSSSSSPSSSPSSTPPTSSSSSTPSSSYSSSSHPPLLLSLLLWLGFLKTALNPVIYVLRIRKFREAFRLAVGPPQGCYFYSAGCCCCCCCPCPRWMDVLGKRRVNPGALYQCD